MEIYYPIQQLKLTQHQEKSIMNITCIFTHQIMHIKQTCYRSAYSNTVNHLSGRFSTSPLWLFVSQWKAEIISMITS
jgi:hypothetical protein